MVNHGPENLCESHNFGLQDLRNGFVNNGASCIAGSCCHWPRLCACDDCAVLRRPSVCSPQYIFPSARLFFPPNHPQFGCNGISCDNNTLTNDINVHLPRDTNIPPPRRRFLPQDGLSSNDPKAEEEKDKLYDLNNNFNDEISQPCISSEFLPRRPRVIVLKDDRHRSFETKSEKSWNDKPYNNFFKQENSSTTAAIQISNSSPTGNKNYKNVERVSLTGEIKEAVVTQAITSVTDSHSSSATSLDLVSSMDVEANDTSKPNPHTKKKLDFPVKRKRYNTRSETTPQQNIFNKDFVTPTSVDEWLKEKSCVHRGRNRTKLNRLLANEHERRRVAQLNLGYQKLRKAIPGYQCDTKLPKIKILRYAIAYIDKLGILLGTENNQLDAKGDNNNNLKN